MTLLALALRVTHLGRSLFTDETYSLALAQRGFGHMFGLFGYEANGTPYPLVLWPLIRLLGTSETVLRAPAVLAGAASVPALWWAAKRLGYRDAVALGAAGLLAVNPMAVWYSQEARPYALVMLAACLAFGALPGLLASPTPATGAQAGNRTRNSTRAMLGYVAAMALLGYSDLLALPIALPAQWLMARRSGREGMRRWLWSLAAVLVCCIPLLVAAMIARSRRNALYWLPKLSRSLVEGAVQEFTGGLSGVSAVRWATVLAVVVLVAAAWWYRRAVALNKLAVPALWGLAPPALLLAVSAVEPVFWPRYAILALPGLCLLVAEAAGLLLGRERGPGRGRAASAGAALAVACLVAVTAAGLVGDARQQSVLQESWPPTVAWLRAERLPREAVMVDNALVLPSLGYYDPAFRAPDGVVVVQEWHDRPLPAGFVGYRDRTSYGSVPIGPPSVASFKELAKRGGGVWLVVSEVDERLQEDPRTGAAVAWARQHCQIRGRASVGVWILHATGCSTSSARTGGDSGST